MLDYILVIPFGLAGIAGFIGFFLKLRELLRVRAYGGRTDAEIVGVKEEIVNPGKSSETAYYSPVIQYRAGGTLYRKTYSKITSPVKQKTGEKIRIRYDLKEPSLFAEEKLTELALQTLGFLVLGVGMLYFIGHVFVR
ncbi:MAG: DUF3592 domain-containing protein [Clostridiales bacterium]|nr:DUF3592 domain-containing protein [Clostridiales bacterium]